MRAPLLAASLAIAGILAACNADGVKGDRPMMQEFISDAIRKADAVVVGTVRRVETVSRQGADYLRLETTVSDAVKGPLAPGTDATIDVAAAGKETPEIAPGGAYAFFLRGAAPAPWQPLDLTEPIAVPDGQRIAFLDALRESARFAARGSVPPDALKQHLLRMLRSGVDLFVADAAKALQTIPTWTEPDVEALLAVLAGQGGGPPPQGNTRDHLAALVVERGAPPRAAGFARAEMANGNSDAVYYGLYKRRDAQTDAILWQLLQDPEPAVRTEALRVTGLLRRTDILDEFERRLTGANPDVQKALEQARALARRD